MKRWSRTATFAAVMFFCLFGGYEAGRRFPERNGAETSIPSAAFVDADPITQFRSERRQTRQMQVSQLNELIHGNDADSEIVTLAQERLMNILDWSEKEVTLEGIMRIREFGDVAVAVHEDSANVLIRTESLTQQQTAVILELVCRETGFSAGNVKIIPIN